MKNKIKFFKVLSLSMTSLFFMVIILYFVITSNSTKDLVKKGLLLDAVIEQENMIFTIQKGYASGFIIGYNSKTIYDQPLGYQVSHIVIDNYNSVIDEKKIYHLMLYHYELGGNQFSGFDFCVRDKVVYYGKNLSKCVHE